MLKFNKLYLLITLGLILLQCAQISSPTGGNKDSSPPSLDSKGGTLPANYSINFNARTIVLNFDEYIQLVNISEQLIVSPPLKTKPKIKLRGKQMIISLNEGLAPKTTYTFNFGSAIRDITEGNISPLSYVVSTGNFLDSLQIQGVVKNAYSLKPKEDILVMLYPKNDTISSDSIPLKLLPRYFTKTDKEGHFIIKNIKKGAYKVFALNDLNGNYLYDLPGEEIAFSTELMTPFAPSKNQSIKPTIYSFLEDKESQYIKKRNLKKKGEITLNFNRKNDKINLNILTQAYTKVPQKLTFTDSLKYWFSTQDSIQKIAVEISDDTLVLDTIDIKLEQPYNFPKSIGPSPSNKFNYSKKARIIFDRPISIRDARKITFFEDSSKVIANFFVDSIRQNELKIDFSLKPEKNYSLYLSPNAISDFFNIPNSDSLKYSFKTARIKDFGNLALKLRISNQNSHPIIIELIDDSKKVVQEKVWKNGPINFEFLNPGKYSLRLIVDKNKNGKWDTGNYFNHLQPEKIYLYAKEITIRANWDLELDWNL